MSIDTGIGPEPFLTPGLSRTRLLEFYRVLARSRALVLRQRAGRDGESGGRGPWYAGQFPPLSALAALWPLRRRDDGSGDVVGLCAPSTPALLLCGDTARTDSGSPRAPGGSPGRHAPPFMADLPRGLLSPASPPGMLLEVMAGVTLAFRIRGEDRVGMVLSGSAESATGAWHEALNLAAVQRCPLVVVMESRQGEHAPHASRPPEGSSPPGGRGPAYGIHAESLTEGDVSGLLDAATRAVVRARSGRGVTLLEVTTGVLDPQGIPGDGSRPREVPGDVDPHDPVRIFRTRFAADAPDLLDELDAIDAEAEAEMAAAPVIVSHVRPDDPIRPPFARPVPRVSPLLPS